MTLLLDTVIVLLDGPRVVSLAFLEYFVLTKITVAPVSKIPIASRAWYCKPMLYGVYCLLNVYIVAMGSLKCML